MTPEDIRLLWRFKGGHALARLAVWPDRETKGFRESMHEASREDVRMVTHADGLHINPSPTRIEGAKRVIGTSDHVITWAAMKAHAVKHTPPDVELLIRSFDQEWCDVTSMPDVPPGQWRSHTAEEEARLAQCVRWLHGLARIVWDPALGTPATPKPEQLDMLTLLEGLT